MKVSFFLVPVIFLVLAGSALAQESNQEYRSIFSKNDGEKVIHGGYGAFGIGYTTLDSKPSLRLSFKGAWVINHRFALGMAGNAFYNNLQKSVNNNDEYLGGGYGGFYFEPILFPYAPVHVSFPVLIGGGMASNTPYHSGNMYYPNDQFNYDSFFVLEPGVEMELNMVKFFRLGVGITYRFTNGVLLEYATTAPVPKNALNSFTFYLNFKFGKF